MVRPSQDEDDDSGKCNDTYTGRNWAEGPPSDSLQSASEHQLDTRQTRTQITSWSTNWAMCSYIGLCVDCNSFVRRNFPAICCSAGCRVAFGLRCISSLELQTCLILSVCHCGVATVVNVVREPQVAFTLQPYLWLASWNEHSPYCMRAHTWRHTQTHTCL